MTKTDSHVFTIPASAPFADVLAREVIARVGAKDDPLALARVTIFLPTRRAVRTLSETFARILGGAALLPEMRPLGDVDEEEFLFDAEAQDAALPPRIEPIRRQLSLAAMVQRWDRDARGSRMSFAQAASLARGLAQFLDEAETQGADLTALRTLAETQHARHWEGVRKFLDLLNTHWPKILEAEGAMNGAAHRNARLGSLRQRLEGKAGDGLIVAAGSTGSIPAAGELLKTIARLPNGVVVLPGLDQVLDDESWSTLEPGHPQYGLKQLLERMDVGRQDVSAWHAPSRSARETLLRETLRPAPTTDAWRALAESKDDTIGRGLEGLSLMEAAHPQEEALAIALILREALETKGQNAALVTPDRNLARRVSAELGRWGIAIDDSAGRPLSKTPPGTFLCLLAEAAEAQFAPVPLLALLKHPFATCGRPPGEFRARVRQLDRIVLRGPRPDAGLAGIAKAIARERSEAGSDGVKKLLENLATWFDDLAQRLKSLAEAMMASACDLGTLIELHVQGAEHLADKDTLWSAEAGNSASALFMEMKEAAQDIPAIEPSSYPILFRSLAAERAVRSPIGRHPRLAILGQQEARLQSFDVVVLGGLNEGTWPRAAAIDPWLSRPMRQKLGLEQPERSIGLAAHDFETLACAPRVFLTRSLKSAGAPTVASRWLLRLKQLTAGLGLESRLVPPQNYAALAGSLDMPSAPARRMTRPAPTPPVETRPRRLSVTEIETWVRDPYAIYAKHVLGLRPLDPLDSEIGPLERGRLIHEALERFLRKFPDDLPADASAYLVRIAEDLFREAEIPHAVLSVWLPRFVRAADWFVARERERRGQIAKSILEIKGERVFEAAAGKFTLVGKADRIDLLKTGGAAIIDYKTGTPPTNPQVASLLTPQLPLEGVILDGGGFADAGKSATSQLIYIQFSGGEEAGKYVEINGDIAALVARAERDLVARIAHFDNPRTPYLPRVNPYRAEVPGDYDHLSRVREWSLIGWEAEEE
jgi:ATP-dependent helicase/nuclease subunit B